MSIAYEKYSPLRACHKAITFRVGRPTRWQPSWVKKLNHETIG